MGQLPDGKPRLRGTLEGEGRAHDAHFADEGENLHMNQPASSAVTMLWVRGGRSCSLETKAVFRRPRSPRGWGRGGNTHGGNSASGQDEPAFTVVFSQRLCGLELFQNKKLGPKLFLK